MVQTEPKFFLDCEFLSRQITAAQYKVNQVSKHNTAKEECKGTYKDLSAVTAVTQHTRYEWAVSNCVLISLHHSFEGMKEQS